MNEQFNPRAAENNAIESAAVAAQGILDAMIGGDDEPKKAPAQAAEVPDEGQPQDVEIEAEVPEEVEASDSVETVEADEPGDGPALEAPNGWSKEMKAKFNTLPREVQEEALRIATAQEQHFTSRNTEATEARKRADAELQAVAQERQHYAAQLNGLLQGLSQIVQQNQTSLDTLAQEAERTGDWNPYFMAKHKLEQSQQAQAQAQQQAQILQQQQQWQDIQTNARALEAMIPTWKDTDVAKKELNEVREHIASNGIPREQAMKVYQAPLLKMARESMLYNRLIAAQKDKTPIVQKKVVNKPPVQKPGVASTQAQIDGRQKAVSTNRQRTTARNKAGAANLIATADRFKGLGIG